MNQIEQSIFTSKNSGWVMRKYGSLESLVTNEKDGYAEPHLDLGQMERGKVQI